MRIIKLSNKLPKEKKEKCRSCGTEFAYTGADLKYDRNESYVICPNPECKKFISV